MACTFCGDDFHSVDNTGDRALYNLAAAIRRRDRADAEYWLDRLVEHNDDDRKEVDLARYSPEAARPRVGAPA